MAGEWLVRLANFENLNVVLLLNFIFVSENHITVVSVWAALTAVLGILVHINQETMCVVSIFIGG